MMRLKAWNILQRVFGIPALLVLLSGCMSLDKAYPDKRFYLIESGKKEHAELPIPEKDPIVIYLPPVQASPPFSGKGLVYRRDAQVYERDFYHEFFVSPAENVTLLVGNHLERSGKFFVTDRTHPLEPAMTLRIAVTALYGDVSDPDNPMAVVALKALATHSRILLHQEVP